MLFKKGCKYKMSKYLTEIEKNISKEFIDNGYIIKKITDEKSLEKIRHKVFQLSLISNNKNKNENHWLNNIHELLSKNELNNYRLNIINNINSDEIFKKLYYEISKTYLEILVGNELTMQKRINLSIQLPNDNSSLLPVHADTWAGDSAYEVVVWLPLVNCFGTKAMYILPQNKVHKLNDNFKQIAGDNAEELFQNIKKDIKWLDIKYGEVLLFNQSLPHGNRVNNEKETRWSMNCRFKGIFTPYADKKLGEFFEPITLRAASKIGMNYKMPKIK